jgi:hypothetical protein
MAIPLDNRQITNVVTSTLDAYRSEIIDNYFIGNALFVRLRSRNKIRWDGGDQIRSHFIYAKLGGGSYGVGDAFDTEVKEFMTDMRLEWKMNYAPMAMYGLDQAKNRGAQQIFSYTDTLKEVCKMTLDDNMGYQLYGDGTGNVGKDIDGLMIAINSTGSYGGITRGTDAIGSAIVSPINTTGGPFSFTMIQNAIGGITIGRESPDLGVTTQDIFNKMWARSQPSEQNRAEDLRRVGFRSVNVSGVDFVVDNHCPAGHIYLLNTKFIEYWVMEGNDFRLRGPFDVHNQDSWVAQYVVYSNLLVKSPRLQTRIENVT